MSSVALGDFVITRVRDGVYSWDGGTFFGVVPKMLWSRKTPADDLNRIQSAFNCYVIRTPEQNILVETGCGDKPNERACERMSVPFVRPTLRERLEEQGIDPDSIDIVINSHLHWDHCGGNTTMKEGVPLPTFPRARYFACRGEWEHAHTRLSRDAVSYIDENYDPLVSSGQMTLVDGDHEVVPGVWMRGAPGHNRDMMVITAESRGQTFCFLSDLVPTAAHTQPTWVLAFDLFPLETIENKHKWLDAAVDGNWVCGFGHEVHMAFARMVRHPKIQFAPEPAAPPCKME